MFAIDRGENNTKPLDIFISAPRLRHLDACTKPSGAHIVTIGSLRLPWSGLTCLVIKHKDVNIWAILQHCLNLVEIQAWIGSNTHSGHHDLPHLKLPFLRSLSFYLPEPSAILSTLTLPVLNLASFTLQEWVRTPYTPSKNWYVSSGFATLLSQSRCTLSKFRLQEVSRHRHAWDLDGVTELMKALPALTELDVSSRFSTDFLQAATIQLANANAPPLVPKLETIALSAHGVHFPWALFEKFLKSRRVVGGPFQLLRSLKLATPEADTLALDVDAQNVRIVDALRGFESLGTRVEVTREEEHQHWSNL